MPDSLLFLRTSIAFWTISSLGTGDEVLNSIVLVTKAEPDICGTDVTGKLLVSGGTVVVFSPICVRSSLRKLAGCISSYSILPMIWFDVLVKLEVLGSNFSFAG